MILWIIMLIPGVISTLTTTQTVHTLTNKNVNKFPGNPRSLNEGNTNILSAPVITVATVGIASGLSEYSSSGDTSSALKAVAKGVTSSTAFYACQQGTSNAVSVFYPTASIPAGYLAGMACAYGSNYISDSVFGTQSSDISKDDKSNDVSDLNTLTQSEINFIIEALSDDNKSVKFNDNIDKYTTHNPSNYDRTSIIINRNDKSDLNNDYDDDVNINTEINESENPKIRKYRNDLRNIARSKREIRQESNYTFKTYNEFIEMNKKTPNSVHPDMVKNYETKLSILKNELNELKKISNELVRLIIEETQLDEFEKLNLSENTVLQQ
jgi:hypothetical protein